MAKSYQEKMYDDYRRTHPTWRRDVNTEQKKKAPPDTRPAPVKKEWNPPTGRQPKYEYHVVKRGSKPAVKSNGGSAGNMSKGNYGVGWVQDGREMTWNGHGNRGSGNVNSTNKAQKRKKTNQLLNSLTRR